jgi:monoamine oxidase
VGQLELIGLKSWGGDPYAGGAWAYFRPGQVERFAKDMAAPSGRIHFCGEHLSASARGLEGALASAETAAGEVLQAESAAI